MRQIGYARVSTIGQDYNGQIAALEAAGCVKVYREKITGARADRPELAKMLKALQPGDVVVVARLDRLARSTRDLLNLLDEIGKAGASFRSLADAWADTTTPHGRLLLTVLGGLAEFERILIATRTGDGRERAKARGVRFGRPRKLSAHHLQAAVARIDAGEPLADIARSYNLPATTIGRLTGACAF
jgi:DNA invertase Pin-like site-specific DNA recombinase